MVTERFFGASQTNSCGVPGSRSHCSPSGVARGFLGTSFHETMCRYMLFPAIYIRSSGTGLSMPSLLSASTLRHLEPETKF